MKKGSNPPPPLSSERPKPPPAPPVKFVISDDDVEDLDWMLEHFRSDEKMHRDLEAYYRDGKPDLYDWESPVEVFEQRNRERAEKYARICRLLERIKQGSKG